MKIISSKKILIRIILTGLICSIGFSKAISRDFYQIKIYSINTEQQEERLDEYFEKAYVPALHRAGIPTVGVFKPIEEDANYGKLIMVWIPFTSLDQFEKLPATLKKDKKYLAVGEDYIEAKYDNPPYTRIESILLRAFKGMPEFAIPNHSTPSGDQIFELRSYEGATEEIYFTKVDMFDSAGEIKLFIDLGFQPVFFGEVISGSSMPNLMYLTTYADTASQASHWDAFIVSDEWTRMKAIEKYKNTVSHIDKYLMHPTEYSDL